MPTSATALPPNLRWMTFAPPQCCCVLNGFLDTTEGARESRLLHHFYEQVYRQPLLLSRHIVVLPHLRTVAVMLPTCAPIDALHATTCQTRPVVLVYTHRNEVGLHNWTAATHAAVMPALASKTEQLLNVYQERGLIPPRAVSSSSSLPLQHVYIGAPTNNLHVSSYIRAHHPEDSAVVHILCSDLSLDMRVATHALFSLADATERALFVHCDDFYDSNRAGEALAPPDAHHHPAHHSDLAAAIDAFMDSIFSATCFEMTTTMMMAMTQAEGGATLDSAFIRDTQVVTTSAHCQYHMNLVEFMMAPLFGVAAKRLFHTQPIASPASTTPAMVAASL